MANDEPFSTAELFEYHIVTGCRVVKAKSEFLLMEPESRFRVFKAAREQCPKWDVLRDPIENDPATHKMVSNAAEAAEMLAAEIFGRGRGHRI